MSERTDPTEARRFVLRPDLLALALVVMLYLAVVAVGYGFHYDFVCRNDLPAAVCQTLSLAVPRVLCVAALTGVLFLTRPEIRTLHRQRLRARVAPAAAGVFLAGLALTLLPLALALFTGQPASPVIALPFWLLGLCLGAAGFAAAFYQVHRPDRSERNALLLLAGAVALGLALPDVTLLFQPFWHNEALTDFTFRAVVGLLELVGETAESDPATKAIRLQDLVVFVGPQCSGVEGFALLSVFMTIYLVLFHDRLILHRAILLLPVAIVMSWVLNVVRIAALCLIGQHISPTLAANGFHSHAGWLAFLLLAGVLALVAHAIPWFRRPDAEPAGARGPTVARSAFFADEMVVYILPFVVFMASSTLTSAVSVVPGLYYPLRMAAVCLVLALGWRVLRGLEFRADPVALLSGLACGLIWIATAPPPDDSATDLSEALATLPALLFAGWALIRILGTSLLVPLVEEMFFRGYLQSRIASLIGEGRIAAWVGIVVSALLFGFLHDRMIAGIAAGLLFGALYLRSGRLGDAILSHAAANAVIAAAAVAGGAWHLI